MIARISPTFPQLAAACFPVAGCSVTGYAGRFGYRVVIRPPQPWAGPPAFTATGPTCYAALAAAVQLFHDSAHAYPDARPLAAAGSYAPPPPLPVPAEPAPDWPSAIRTQQSSAQFLQRLQRITRPPNAAATTPTTND